MTEELPYYPPMAFVFSNVPQHSQANYEIARFFQEAQEKIVWLEKEQEDARSDIKVIFYFPTPNPLPNFYCRSTPWYKFLSLPSLPLPWKPKMAVIIFAKKILSTRSPKLRLLCWLVLEVRHKCCLVLARWVFRLWEIVIMETQGSLSSRRSQILNTPSSENWCRTKVKVFIGNDTVYKAASGNLRNSIGISFCHKVCHFFNRVRNWNLSRTFAFNYYRKKFNEVYLA